MIINSRYVCRGEMVIDFIGNICIADGKADPLVTTIEQSLKNLSVELMTLVGLGCDSAFVKTGRTSGLVLS